MTVQPVVDPKNLSLGDCIKAAFDLFMKDPVNWIIIGLVGSVAIGVGYWGGFQLCAMKALKGEKPAVADVLAPFSRFVDYFLPFLITYIGYCICILPGVYLTDIGSSPRRPLPRRTRPGRKLPPSPVKW
jgi:hypothetical protein